MRYEPRPCGRGYWGIFDTEAGTFDDRYLCINAAEAAVVANLKNKELAVAERNAPAPERSP